MRSTEAEAGEGPRLVLATIVVGLVGDEQHGTIAALEDVGDLGVVLGDADVDVDDHEDHVGIGDRALGLHG